jgi:hypothetical protein
VIYATASGSAAAGLDFASKSARLTFQPGGATVARVSIALTNDALFEANEQFFVNLSSASGATIADAQGTATIVDNDAPATGRLSITGVRSTEGNAATGKKYSFAVRLAAPVAHTVSVQYETADGTATSGHDYRAARGTLNFAPGETTKYVSVTVYGDRVKEGHEAFLVWLSQPVGATLASSYAIGTLLNEDTQVAASASPQPIVDPRSYFEGEDEHAHEHIGQAGSVISDAAGVAPLPARLRRAVAAELAHAHQDASANVVDLIMRQLAARL